MNHIGARLALMFFSGMLFGHLVTNIVASQGSNHNADFAYGCGMLMGEHVMRPSELGASDFEPRWCAVYRKHREAWEREMAAREEKP